MGFLQICAGVVLLQLSKSAKDVPDAAIFKGDLDQVREVAEQEHPETEPKADAIRGAASIVRRLSTPRRHMEQAEARRLREEKMADLQPLNENEVVEWDGLRRRKTVIGSGPTSSPTVRRRTVHPPLGMAHIPEENGSPDSEPRGVVENFKRRAQTMIPTGQARHGQAETASPVHPVALTDIKFKGSDANSPALPYGPGSFEEAQEHIYGHPVSKGRKPVPSPRSKPLPDAPAPSPGFLNVEGAKRQFSFSNMFRHSPRQSGYSTDTTTYARPTTASSHAERKAMKNATEEERLGLVQGDSSRGLLSHNFDSSPEHSRDQAPRIARTVSSPESSVYYSNSQHHHRSDSPDAISDPGARSDDDNPYQTSDPSYMQPFRSLSNDPSPQTSIIPGDQQTGTPRPPSRRRPSPPAVYTPPPIPPTHARDFAQSNEQISQLPSLAPPSQPSVRRVTIGSRALSDQNINETTARSTSVLEPPIQFLPSMRDRSVTHHSSSISSAGPSYEDVTQGSVSAPNLLSAATTLPAPSRGRGATVEESHTVNSGSASPERRRQESQNGSKERFVEQSAREREERRARAQKRMSMGRQSTDFS